jgi:hypothetical protein
MKQFKSSLGDIGIREGNTDFGDALGSANTIVEDAIQKYLMK